jgi:hypothetical protein
MLTGLVIVQIAWIAVILLPVLVILGEWISGTAGGDSSVDAEAQKKAGLVIVRVAWMTAFLVAVLVILGELFSGTDGGDSSQQLPEVASAPPAGVEAQKKPQKTQRAKEQGPGDSHSSSGVPGGSADQPGDAAGTAPVVTPPPKPPQAPRPKPPRAPPKSPVPTQPPVSESPSSPVQTTITVANNNGPVGGP